MSGSPVAPMLRLLLGLAVFGAPVQALSQTTDFRGQVSGWLGASFQRGGAVPAGLRYIPTFSLKTAVAPNWNFDVEAAANVTSAADLRSGLGSLKSEIKPYRLWARLTSERFEARFGLQKINFGPAQLLRPLMWFDRLDPNDPLQLTDGVTGLLLKYTFQNNAGLWLWGLFGNSARKGWESFPSRRDTPEIGGRAQVPVLGGELAATFHFRRLDAFHGLLPVDSAERAAVPETRLGLDGYWNVGPGIWFEATLIRQDFTVSPYRFQKALNVGFDNSFAIGGGLHVLAEHLVFQSSLDLAAPGSSRSLSALSVDFPLGLLDRLRGVVFRDWTNREEYHLLTWQRTYDRWSFFAIAFWNPDRYGLYGGSPNSYLFAGKGVQIMLVWNH
jgi:hypothetical protein